MLHREIHIILEYISCMSSVCLNTESNFRIRVQHAAHHMNFDHSLVLMDIVFKPLFLHNCIRVGILYACFSVSLVWVGSH